MPPHSDNKLIFFAYKTVLVNGVRCKSWKETRELSLKDIPIIPPSATDLARRFTKREWPPLVVSSDQAARTTSTPPNGPWEPSGEGTVEKVWGEGLTKTKPRAYQSELFRTVMDTERNSLVYLPTGLGKTLVSIMVVQRLLELNPDRQAVFLVETNALAIQQVRRCFIVIPL